MAIMKESDKRFLNLQKKVGAFVVTTVVMLIIIIVYIGIRQDLFTPKTTIYFITSSGYDLNEGQAVKLSGFKIGKVKKVTLEDNARVKVELSITTKYMKWVKIDSRTRLIKEGLIGDSIIEITPGSANAKEAVGDIILPFQREKGFGEIAAELTDEIKPALKDLRQIISYVNDPNSDIKQTLKNVNTLTREVIETKRQIDAMLTRTDKNLNETFKNVNSTLTTVNSMVEKVDKDLPGMLDKAGKTLDNVQKTTEEIKKVAEQAAPQIPSLVEKGSAIADDTKEITGSLKKMWPIRLFITNPEEKILKTDSYE